MQVIDTFLWLDNDVLSASVGGLSSCSITNRVVTRLGLAIICLEPMAALLGTSMIAKKGPPPKWAIALYSFIFLGTPLAGWSFLIEPYPCAAFPNSNGGEVLTSGDNVCRRMPDSDWGSCLFDIKTPTVCSSVTPSHHILYGGHDLFYHKLLSPWDEIITCRVAEAPSLRAQSSSSSSDGSGSVNVDNTVEVQGAKEIPLLLRFIFLASMAIPYAVNVKPLSSGLAHASILTGTWLAGLFSDAHASVWCLANVAQGTLMLAEPWIWPEAFSSSSSSSSSSSPTSNGGGGSSSSSSSSISKNTLARRPTLYNKKRVPEKLDAIVVGSGIGGMGLAALLSRAGKRVLVLEKHYRPGGCTHAFTEIGDNVFDSGVHYVGGGPLMQRMLSNVCATPLSFAKMGTKADGWTYDLFDLGEDITASPTQPSPQASPDEREAWERKVVERAHWWEHEPRLHYLRAERLEESLIEQFPHEKEGILSYIGAVRDATSFFDGTNAMMLTKLPAPGFVRSWLYNRVERHAFRTAREVVEEHVTDPRLRALLSSGQMIDWNLPPGQVSWLVAAGMMMYYDLGGYYPSGGSNNIPYAMMPEIERMGGAVLCNASVDHILTEGNVVKGVRMSNGDELHAPIVVSAAGFSNTYEKMLEREQLSPDVAAAVDRTNAILKPSHSHICAYISLDGPPEAFGLKSWNIHSFPELPKYKYDVDAYMADFYDDPFAQKECLMTLTCPSAKDPLYGKDMPGRSNVLLLIEGIPDAWYENFEPSRHGRRPDAYKEAKGRFESMFVDRLLKYYPRCEGHITNVEISTPLTAEHFINAPKGASYGLEWTPEHFDRQLHETVFTPKIRGIDGLYMTGEAVCFGGVMGALATSFGTAAHILGWWQFGRLLLENRKSSWPDFE